MVNTQTPKDIIWVRSIFGKWMSIVHQTLPSHHCIHNKIQIQRLSLPRYSVLRIVVIYTTILLMSEQWCSYTNMNTTMTGSKPIHREAAGSQYSISNFHLTCLCISFVFHTWYMSIQPKATGDLIFIYPITQLHGIPRQLSIRQHFSLPTPIQKPPNRRDAMTTNWNRRRRAAYRNNSCIGGDKIKIKALTMIHGCTGGWGRKRRLNEGRKLCVVGRKQIDWWGLAFFVHVLLSKLSVWLTPQFLCPSFQWHIGKGKIQTSQWGQWESPHHGSQLAYLTLAIKNPTPTKQYAATELQKRGRNKGSNSNSR